MSDRVKADILIVDRDPKTRADYRSWLEDEGYKVDDETDNGKFAFRLCNRKDYRLVITAISIEDWDGIDYIISNSLIDPKQKILVIDYLTEENIDALVQEPTVVGWLQKSATRGEPITKEEFLRSVKAALQ